MAVGDFNGDGKLDLVTANDELDNVSVMSGDGTGKFGAAKSFGVGDKPQGVAVADFNGDNKPDIVTVNYNSHNISILLNNGLGGFAAATNYSVGFNPHSVAVGDFNGDGKADLAVTNTYSHSITILTGNGTGGFSSSSNMSQVGAHFVAVSDFNRDGKADLVVGSSGFFFISVRYGDGAGGFGAATEIQTGQAPEYVAVGDLNGDGSPDLAVANTQSNPAEISVVLNNGTGGFAQPVPYRVGNRPVSISIGDFTHDGKADLGVATQYGGNVTILPGSGTGTFGVARDYEIGFAFATVVGDFNTDGRTDLAVSYNPTGVSIGKVSVLFNSCNAVPEPEIPPTPGTTYTISGKVTNSRSGFTFVRLSGTQAGEVGVDENGNYIFRNLPSGGTYTVTPRASDSPYYQYTFSPSSQTFTKLGSNQVADFTQNLVTNSISGKVGHANGVGIAGIEVVLNMGTGGKTVTDNNGNYSFPNVASGNSYQVGPASLDYMFTPYRHDITNLSGDVIANFTATPLYNITGRVTNQSGAAMAGVFVSVNGPMSRSTTTDSNGNYLLNSLPEGGNYIMSLSKGGYAFDPPGRTFNNLGGHQTANFTGIPAFNITGRVALPNNQGIGGVTVAVNGTYPSGTPYAAMTTTYNDGFYSLSFLASGGTYTITPSKADYIFQPASKTFTNLSADQVSNFVGLGNKIQLILDASSTEPDQAVALDALLFLRDPFPVISAASLLNKVQDRNTRVIVLVANLQLLPGETPSAVTVNLVDGNNQIYEVGAEVVQPMASYNLTEVVFRLPDNLSSGVCSITVKAHGVVSNTGKMTIKN